MTKILQKYGKFSFYNDVYSYAVSQQEWNRAPWYWYVYWWTHSVNDTLFLLQKVLIGQKATVYWSRFCYTWVCSVKCFPL